MVCVVIMAGGKGERFWPRSRAGRPKQFTDRTGSGNMLAVTYRRAAKIAPPERIFVVTGREYEDVTKESLPGHPPQNIIIEPEGRNTAPCIGLAAVILENRFPGSVMVVVPADHLIKDDDKFAEDIKTAADAARSTGGLVTLGITPTRPETGYGYLQTGRELSHTLTRPVYKVDRYIEKPDAVQAAGMVSGTGYLWNCGIFIWKVSAILEAFRVYLPGVYDGLRQIKNALNTGSYMDVLNRIYPGLQKVSIDYGIMEKAAEVYVVPGNFYWDDVGTWKALERILEPDSSGNVLRGKAVALATRNTIIDTDERLVAVIGVENLVIVDTDDVTFVCHKDQTDLVRKLLEELRSQKLEKYL